MNPKKILILLEKDNNDLLLNVAISIIKNNYAKAYFLFVIEIPHKYPIEFEIGDQISIGENTLKYAQEYLSFGVDCIYVGNHSLKWIKAMRDNNIPTIGHVGLVPGKATWIGGLRAIGKTAEEGIGVLKHTLALQEAGVIGVELEVVPPRVAKIITEKVDIITMSMGSGSDCDAQFLFSNDVLGWNEGHIPRHARIYRNFKKEYNFRQMVRISHASICFSFRVVHGSFRGSVQFRSAYARLFGSSRFNNNC